MMVCQQLATRRMFDVSPIGVGAERLAEIKSYVAQEAGLDQVGSAWCQSLQFERRLEIRAVDERSQRRDEIGRLVKRMIAVHLGEGGLQRVKTVERPLGDVADAYDALTRE